jgi:hypothetical protein
MCRRLYVQFSAASFLGTRFHNLKSGVAVIGGGTRLTVDFVNCELQNETCHIFRCIYPC